MLAMSSNSSLGVLLLKLVIFFVSQTIYNFAVLCRCYFYIPFDEHKPLLWVKAVFEDHRKRMYNTNLIEKIVAKAEDDLSGVSEMIKQEKPFTEKHLQVVLEDLATSCSKYLSLTKGKAGGGGSQPGRNKLDKERSRMCHHEMVRGFKCQFFDK